MGEAEVLWERLTGRKGYKELCEITGTYGKGEMYHIDYKRVAERGQKTVAQWFEAYRNTFSEAASGFANADGGVLVWGVDCKSKPKRKPFKDYKLFASHLQKVSQGCTVPRIGDMDHKAIPDKTRKGTGYVVTYIAATEGEPHMVSWGPNVHRYLGRRFDGCFPMEHRDIAAMFGRRPHPRLELEYRIGWGGKGSLGDKQRYEITLYIRNAGRGIALYPALFWKWHLDGSPGNLSGFGKGSLLGEYERGEGWHGYVGGHDSCVHPMTKLHAATFAFKVYKPEEVAPLRLTAELYCASAKPHKELLQIEKSEILKKLGPWYSLLGPPRNRR